MKDSSLCEYETDICRVMGDYTSFSNITSLSSHFTHFLVLFNAAVSNSDFVTSNGRITL
jgi:hypothetical protein